MTCGECNLFDISGRTHEFDRDGLCRWRPSEPMANPYRFGWNPMLVYESEGADCPQFTPRAQEAK